MCLMVASRAQTQVKSHLRHSVGRNAMSSSKKRNVAVTMVVWGIRGRGVGEGGMTLFRCRIACKPERHSARGWICSKSATPLGVLSVLRQRRNTAQRARN